MDRCLNKLIGATDMNYTTHNDKESLESAKTGSSLMGEIEATYAELRSLFGKPRTWDDGKVDAEWVIEFSDKTIATVHNWKDGKAYLGEVGLDLKNIKRWSVGGFSPAAATMVQIALDLSREDKDSDKGSTGEQAFESAFAVMDNIAKTKGENYAALVELVILTIKRRQLMDLLLAMLGDMTEMPDHVRKGIEKIDNEISVRTISRACHASTVEFKNDKEAGDLMDWAGRVISCEEVGIESLMKSMFKKGS